MPTAKRVPLAPYWTSECGRAVVHVGDCLDVMTRMDPRQFHAVVTDPPYGLEFMGREWDAPWKQDGSTDARQKRADEMNDPVKAQYLRHNTTYGKSNPRAFQAWFLARTEAMLRVARPGAHLLSFGGTRMWHRMACAVEDAGWEVRDTIMWLYGSGMPKGLDVSKAVDNMLGAERSEIGEVTDRRDDGTVYGIGHSGNLTSNNPITDAARQWDGWNTALKPAHEPIILARRPLRGSVAECVLDEGCGAINVGACKVGTEGGTKMPAGGKPRCTNKVYGHGMGGTPVDPDYSGGRWPANVIHDGSDEVVDLLPETGPSRRAVMGKGGDDKGNAIYGKYGDIMSERGHDDQGGSAARFFYTAKADADDRPHGKGATTHPTVKPLDLMRYLVRLVCVPGGTVLDPFMGSGSTGCAALAEGMLFVGVEQSEEYADLAVGRLRLALQTAPVHVWEPLGWATKSEVDVPPPPRKLRS